MTLDFPAVLPEEEPVREPVKAAKTQPQKAKAQVQKAKPKAQPEEDEKKEKAKEPVSKDILIRQILEEFMA